MKYHLSMLLAPLGGFGLGAHIRSQRLLNRQDEALVMSIRQLIVEDRRQKTIHRLEECVPSDVERIRLKDTRGFYPVKGDKVKIDGFTLKLQLSDHLFMPELRWLARDFMAAGGCFPDFIRKQILSAGLDSLISSRVGGRDCAFPRTGARSRP